MLYSSVLFLSQSTHNYLTTAFYFKYHEYFTNIKYSYKNTILLVTHYFIIHMHFNFCISLGYHNSFNQ